MEKQTRSQRGCFQFTQQPARTAIRNSGGVALRMKFGAHRGEHVHDLPNDYLEWLSTIELSEPLRTEVLNEMRTREERSKRAPDRQADFLIRLVPWQAPLVREIVDAGYRSLALKLHPDQGGSTAAMQTLNKIIRGLREQLPEGL